MKMNKKKVWVVKMTKNKKKVGDLKKEPHRHPRHLFQPPNEDEGYLADDEGESDDEKCEVELEDEPMDTT